MSRKLVGAAFALISASVLSWESAASFTPDTTALKDLQQRHRRIQRWLSAISAAKPLADAACAAVMAPPKRPELLEMAKLYSEFNNMAPGPSKNALSESWHHLYAQMAAVLGAAELDRQLRDIFSTPGMIVDARRAVDSLSQALGSNSYGAEDLEWLTPPPGVPLAETSFENVMRWSMYASTWRTALIAAAERYQHDIASPLADLAERQRKDPAHSLEHVYHLLRSGTRGYDTQTVTMLEYARMLPDYSPATANISHAEKLKHAAQHERPFSFKNDKVPKDVLWFATEYAEDDEMFQRSLATLAYASLQAVRRITEESFSALDPRDLVSGQMLIAIASICADRQQSGPYRGVIEREINETLEASHTRQCANHENKDKLISFLNELITAIHGGRP